MQEELKNVLTLFRERRRNLDIVKTPEIFIQQTSKPEEVQKWLEAKGFSDKTVKKLHGLTGNELFALNRKTLEEYCGPDEGKRLASQITIQRNVSGVRLEKNIFVRNLTQIELSVQNCPVVGTLSDFGKGAQENRDTGQRNCATHRRIIKFTITTIATSLEISKLILIDSKMPQGSRSTIITSFKAQVMSNKM